MRKSGGWISFWQLWSSRVLLVALVVSGIRVARAQSGVDFNNILRATVFVTSVYETPAGPAVSCAGSGTLVSAEGLILTNAHIVSGSDRCRVEDVAIALSVRTDEPPVPTYFADVVHYDLGLDLAVLRITRQIDGRVVDRSSLSLPFVELGDSDQLQLDDTVSVFGYAGIGNDPVTFSRGTILGFVSEPRGGERAWLKTSATILGPMSGGAAYNVAGQLIGVPTTAPSGVGSEAVDCREIQDTNGDQLVDSRDNCVPIGGFINALRPVALARGLVQAARLGIHDEGHQFSGRQQALSADEEPIFGAIHFSPGVNEAGMPTSFVTRLPAGASSLYLFFDYDHMRPGVVYELRTTIGGAYNPGLSLSPALWSGGRRGLWYIGSANRPWPNGDYEFTLYIEGRPVSSAQLTIGGAPQSEPVFSDISFGLLDLQGNILGSGFVLPSGNVASANFIFRNMSIGTAWTQVWFYEDIELSRVTASWEIGPDGSTTISIRNDQGLLPGRYRLELWVGDRLSALSDFLIAGAQEGVLAQVFENERFSSEVGAGAPAGIVTESFSNPIPSLFAFIDWRLLGSGTPWTYRWLVDGNVLFEGYEPWQGPESGSNFWMQLGSDSLLPDGSYRLDILLANQLLVSKTVRVGLGQLPVTQENLATGVQLAGRVTDAENGDGISGVMFIVLRVEFSVEDFTWDQSQIYDMSITDSTGRYEIARLLQYDQYYSVVIMADGYLPVSAAGIYLDPENPVEGGARELPLQMNRDYAS